MGIPDVDGMLRRLPAPMFRKWEWYYEIQPFGNFREDARMARIAATVFNMAVRVEDRKPDIEFMFPWTKPEKDEQAELEKLPKMPDGTIITEQIWYAMCWAAAHAAGASDPSKVIEVEKK